MKKYLAVGGILGLIIGAVVSIYFASQIECVGMYANPDGTFGTTCAKITVLELLKRDIQNELLTTLVFILIGLVLALIIGKIVQRHGMVQQ